MSQSLRFIHTDRLRCWAHPFLSFKILLTTCGKMYRLWYMAVNKFLILFQLNQVDETCNFLWRCKWQVISSVFLLRISIIRLPDQNLILIFSGLRYAQTFSWRWLNNLQSAFNQWGCNLGIGNGVSWGDVFPLPDDVHIGFVLAHTCVIVFLAGFIYVSRASFDQLLASRFF